MTPDVLSPEDTPGFAGGQVVTVFRSRRRPGLVDFSTFESPDGERVSLVTFDSPETHAAWRDDPHHRAARRQGQDEPYDEYSVQVSLCTGATRWHRRTD
jgi:heme-degrading monooxygenase HmoA